MPISSPTTPRLPTPVAERLGRLAEDQRGAATASPGPVLCVAPAGSGKTTTVVARIAWRLAQGATSNAMYALTFNRRAAEELQARSDAAIAEIGFAAGSVPVRTFHALGRQILADAGRDVTRIVDRGTVLKEMSQGSLSPAGLRWLDDAFTRMKLDPERAPPPSDIETGHAYAAYQAVLRQGDSLDLDDLVALAGPTLRSDAALLARWQGRCGVLFVDEAQDLDHSQLDLAVLLAGDRRDIFLVGDDDQTIYAWRLADVRRVLGLASRLPGLHRVDLATNHRCAPEIVHRAARLVSHNQERFQKSIRASPRAAGVLTLAADSADDAARARRLFSTWATQHSEDPTAVLARTNRELAPYVAVALELGIPLQVQQDGLDLGDSQINATLEMAAIRQRPGEPLLLALRSAAAEGRLSTAATASLLAWAAPFPDPIALATAYRARSDARTRLIQTDARLTLATVHGTKGLEWDHVACVGFDAEVFPSGRALREASDPSRVMEEERRLAYVAWTRARLSLTIVYDPGAPSPFLLEAFDPKELA